MTVELPSACRAALQTFGVVLFSTQSMLTIFLHTCGYLHGLYFIIKMPDEISMCSHAPAKALFANVQVATSCGRERERERNSWRGEREGSRWRE